MNPSTRTRRLLSLVCFACVLSLAPAQERVAEDDDPFVEDIEAAEKSRLKGDHSKARAAYVDILDALEEEDEDQPGAAVVLRARQGLIELELVKGNYARVIAIAAKLPAADQTRYGTEILVARALFRTGSYEAAAKLLRKYVAAGKPPAGQLGFEARYRLGLAVVAAGQVVAGRRVFEAAIAKGDRQSVRDPLDICYLARCHLTLGGRAHLEQAASLLVESIRLAPERPEARTAYGELNFIAYRETRGRPHAEKYIKKVLDNNGEVEEALLVMYRARSFNMQLRGGDTAGFLNRALALNPHSVEAMVARASRLIDDRRFGAGRDVLDRGLQVNPRHRAALSHRAAVAYLLHDDEAAKAFRKRALAGRPGYVEIDRIFGDHLVALYRFADAIPYYEKALTEDYVPAMHGLAKALVYTGQGGKAVDWLKKAKRIQAGYANAWRKNILLSEKRLAEEYDVIERGGFVYLMHKSDRAVLEDYLARWFEEAREFLGRKYGYVPKNKVRVEVLHEWVDFSVRTIGFRGFMALGACFGEFVTMVSPSDPDLRRNDFMWSATAWHEYAHVLTLALSKHRVPRWLTEGMSVYEESAKNRSWERGMLRELLDAYHNKDLPPLRLLNRLFRGSRILFGYYQGGLVVEYLAEKHGFPKVVSMLRAYGEDQSTAAIFKSTFGLTTREFDARFRTWVLEKKLEGLRLVPRFNGKAFDELVATVEDEPDDLDARVKLAWAFLQRRFPVQAGIQIGAVMRANSDHAMANLAHAELLRQRAETARRGGRDRLHEAAIAAYEKGFKTREADDFESRLNYGGLLERRGDLESAIHQYQAAKACWPTCTDQKLSPQLRIARVLRKMDKLTEAMMEMKSFCRLTARAFKPRMDLAAYEKKLGNRKAEAGYLEEAIQIDPFMRSLHERLGDAYVSLGRLDGARREYTVGLAVPTAMDRARLEKRAPNAPTVTEDSPEEAEARGELCVKIARVNYALGDKKEAAKYLDRAEAEAPNSDVADVVHELRVKWKL